jgi:hypothetical protein
VTARPGWRRRGDGLRPFRRWAVVWRNGIDTAFVITSHFSRAGVERGLLAASLRKGPWTGRPDRPLSIYPTAWGPRRHVRNLIVDRMPRDRGPDVYVTVEDVCRRTALPVDVVVDVLLDLGRTGWAVTAGETSAPHEARWRIRTAEEVMFIAEAARTQERRNAHS